MNWGLLFELVPWMALAELLLLMGFLVFAHEELIPGNLYLSQEAVTTLRIELCAKQAELDALKEKSWPLKS